MTNRDKFEEFVKEFPECTEYSILIWYTDDKDYKVREGLYDVSGFTPIEGYTFNISGINHELEHVYVSYGEIKHRTVKEVTMEEICEMFGCEVKIIKE